MSLQNTESTNDPPVRSDTLTELRTSRLLENRKNALRDLRDMTDLTAQLLPEEVRPRVMARLKRKRDRALKTLQDAERIDHSPYAGKGQGEQNRIATLESALQEIADTVAEGDDATVTLARLALSLSGMEEAGLITPSEERTGAEADHD